ncbi:hypothetical protein ACQEVB_27835 [Pseudonocardia sp. CA-107938]|uniref:hypothetical protein n=1 Tax=Pseudonocardia sp. CA-107938 TaxID=3240021 RepID=UPI003D930402
MTRYALLTAPVLLFCYGVVRLTDPTRSVSAVWTVSHVFYLAAFPALALSAVALHRLVGDRSVLGRGLVALSVVGALSGVGQALVDLLAGWGAPDKAARALAANHLRDVIPGSSFFYGFWPALAQVGIVGLLVLAARAGRVPWWCAPLALAAFLLPTLTSLDLIPVAAVAVVPAVLPAFRAAGSTDEFGARRRSILRRPAEGSRR